MTRIATVALLGAALSLPLVATAAAQSDYPSRPIRGLTTSSAGGISDIFLRVLGDELARRWKTTFIVDNRPGGAQNVGTRACSDAEPDGYTICIINADPLVYNQFLIKNMPFDPETAVQPVTGLFHLIQNMVADASLGVKNIDELVALSKSKPGTLSYQTASMPMQIYMDWLRKEKGADWVRVPFRGGGQAVSSVLNGSSPIALIGEANFFPHLKAGKVVPIVMINNVRSTHFPDVPTLEETGYKGPPSRSWYGIFVPPKTPRAIVDKLNKEIQSIVSDKGFLEKNLTQRSLIPFLNTPEEFDKVIRADRAAAKTMMESAGIVPN